MADDAQRLALPGNLIDVVIADVKTNQPCTLNRPWARQDRQNVHHVLAAIGCLQPDRIDKAAADIYRTGSHRSDTPLRIRLVAVGRDRSGDLAAEYPAVTLASVGSEDKRLDHIKAPQLTEGARANSCRRSAPAASCLS